MTEREHLNELHTSESVSLHRPEKGLISFIKTKLEQSVHPDDITQILARAGFSMDHINTAFTYVRKIHRDMHQDLVAINDFLPPLSKKGNPHSLHMFSHTYQDARNTSSTKIGNGFVRKGLFTGRLRRKEFVIGFLFFFAVGYVISSMAALLIAYMMPDVWRFILDIIESDTHNYLLMIAPVALAPITVFSLSLIARRLHNLGLPGGLSFLFLLWFVPAFEQVYSFGFAVLEIVLLVLFIVLVTVKGNPAPNKYGPLPSSRGSFFRRIFNV